MDEMEDKIGAILNNPQMMQQIMSMAQSFSAQTPQGEPPPGGSLGSPRGPAEREKSLNQAYEKAATRGLFCVQSFGAFGAQ